MSQVLPFQGARAEWGLRRATSSRRLGYTGIPDLLDGAYGTFFSSFLDEWSEPALTEGLGTRWETLRVGFKPAPASNGSITAMTAIDKVMQSVAWPRRTSRKSPHS